MFTRRRLVLETLAPVPEDRKCFRLINGILVERTVADVIPALKTNAEGLKSVLEGLVKEYKKKQEEMDKWKVRTALPFPLLLLRQYLDDCHHDSLPLYSSHPFFLITCQLRSALMRSSLRSEHDLCYPIFSSNPSYTGPFSRLGAATLTSLIENRPRIMYKW